MTHIRRRFPMVLALLLTAPIMVACGSSDPASPGPGGGGGNQTATAVATPSSATISRGATTSTTVVFSATGGLTIGRSFTISRQYGGITVNQTSTQTSGTTITTVYAISADATVPTGAHEVRFSTPVTGYTDGSSSMAGVVFTLTVTP